EKLAKQILNPLRERLAPAREWIISPDGALWLVPWGILPLEDGSYAVEKHKIRYVITGRDLIRQHAAHARGDGAAVVLANPDFDLNADQARETWQAVIRGEERQPAEVRTALVAGLLPERVGALPGTKMEADTIGPLLERWTGKAPQVYTEAQALT